MINDLLYGDDGVDLRTKMIGYIRSNFAHILGDDVRLLDEPDGLDKISAKYGL